MSKIERLIFNAGLIFYLQWGSVAKYWDIGSIQDLGNLRVNGSAATLDSGPLVQEAYCVVRPSGIASSLPHHGRMSSSPLSCEMTLLSLMLPLTLMSNPLSTLFRAVTEVSVT